MIDISLLRASSSEAFTLASLIFFVCQFSGDFVQQFRIAPFVSLCLLHLLPEQADHAVVPRSDRCLKHLLMHMNGIVDWDNTG